MSIFGTLRNTINTFDALSQAVEVTQNNIANASSPGYVRQSLRFVARPFEVGTLTGGVAAGPLQSSRQDYAERNVRLQTEKRGALSQAADLFAQFEQVFDVSGKTGVAAEMSDLFASFSAWSLHPNDAGARRSVVSSLQNLAGAFNGTAVAISNEAISAEQQTRTTVNEINRLVGVLREINVGRRSMVSTDPGMEARLYSTLDELSDLVNVSASVEQDGTVSLSLGGRYPLLVGDHQTEISISAYHDENPTYPAALPAVHVKAGDTDVTEIVQSGRLSALLDFRNGTVPSLLGGAETVGELNQLAKAFADRVNTISTDGGGPALFTYDAANVVRAASTLAVAGGLTASDLVAAGSTANDIPLALAALANPQSATDKIAGVSYSAYFAQIVSRVGAATAESKKAADVQADVLTQAQTLRSNMSGVSLDEEAVKLIEFQRSYEAMARMSSVLNEMTETILTLLR